MKKLTIELPDGLYAELVTASAEAHEPGFRAKHWAQECVQSALASRRLPRVTQRDVRLDEVLALRPCPVRLPR
jgi:hypothetical protein